MRTIEEKPVKKKSRTDSHNFPAVEMRKVEEERLDNLAPIVFNLSSRRDPSDLIKALRVACKYESIERVARDLGLRDEGEYPLTTQRYDISFYGIPQVLPVAVVKERFGDGQRIQAIGTIPLNPLSIDGWTLGFKQRWGDDGGGCGMRVFQNFMEKREHENSATFMRAWMQPYIEKGIEFKPKKWFGFFEYNAAKLRDDNLVQFYDRAKIQVEFNASPEGLSFYGNFQAKFKREILSSDGKLEFAVGGPRGIEKDPHPDWPKLVKGGEKFTYSPEGLARMAKTPSWGDDKDAITHDDLVAASVFPNARGDKRRVDYAESLHCLLETFRDGRVDDLAGYRWVKFE